MEASATSKSQLYHYFADKDALMRAVIEFQTRRVTGGESSRPEAIDSLDGLRRWRDAAVSMNRAARGVGGCPLGSLVSQLGDRSESARALLAHGFELWELHFRQGLSAMRDRGELKAEADPAELATAVIAALQGGLLLAQTARASRPLELALDMAIGHVARLSR
jgi:AcrR family transcriptional regulator